MKTFRICFVGCFVLRRFNPFGSFNAELSHFDKSFKTIQFSMKKFFVYTQLKVKNSSNSNNSV